MNNIYQVLTIRTRYNKLRLYSNLDTLEYYVLLVSKSMLNRYKYNMYGIIYFIKY